MALLVLNARISKFEEGVKTLELGLKSYDVWSFPCIINPKSSTEGFILATGTTLSSRGNVEQIINEQISCFRHVVISHHQPGICRISEISRIMK